MTKNLSLLALVMIALAFTSPALAQSSRTFVSVTGADSGSCPTAEPCRTFAYALTQTAASGEIIVLSSGGYGALTINQAVSIINTSNFAGVTVASGNGITIAAGTTDSVTLRGLTIDGGGTGSNGVVFNTGGSLTIDQCDVMNFAGSGSTGNGIIIQPTSGSHNIVITNTTASDNQGSGILYSSHFVSKAITGIVIDHVSANNNAFGITMDNTQSASPYGTLTASISNSNANLNTQFGFYFSWVTGSLDASAASSNGMDGVRVVGTGSTLALGRSVSMNNGEYGLYYSGSSTTVNSYGDNRIAGNSSGQVSPAPAAATLY
jgi:hypothetical protein